LISSGKKTNFTTFGPPWKDLGKIPYCLPLEKYSSDAHATRSTLVRHKETALFESGHARRYGQYVLKQVDP